MRNWLLILILAIPAFAAEQAAPKTANPTPAVASMPTVSDATARTIMTAERDILSIGRNMDALSQQYKDLLTKQEAAQKAMQDGVAQAYKEAGDPEKKKLDLNVETLTFSPKPADTKPLVPKN